MSCAPNQLVPRRRPHPAGRRAGQWIAVFCPSSRRRRRQLQLPGHRVGYLLAVVVPPPAPHLRFAASNSSSVTIQWSMSGSGNNRTTKKISPVRSFILNFRPSRPTEFQQHEWRERILPAGWRSVPVGDLDCGSQYEFSLTASSHRVGNSSSSNLVTAKTKGSPTGISKQLTRPLSCSKDGIPKLLAK